MDLGTAIKTVRKQKGVSQKELASLCGLAINTLCHIERCYTMPSKATMKKISKALNIPSAYILFFSITDEDIAVEQKPLFDALCQPIKNVLLDDISKR